MKTSIKSLFASILKAWRADCICDIGSREGDQSLLFRQLLPTATVLAFEANPINFEEMAANPNLKHNRIELFPYAISNRRGQATFFVADVDYSDPNSNRGTSSLLVSEDQKVRETVEVETHRIDEFISSRYPNAQKIGLWIDVEGAEFAVLEGMHGIKDRIVAICVETTNEPRWQGQRSLRELQALMADYGFVIAGRNFGGKAAEWGDVLFISKYRATESSVSLAVCQFKAYAIYISRADYLAVWLKRHLPWLYRMLRWAYIKLGT